MAFPTLAAPTAAASAEPPRRAFTDDRPRSREAGGQGPTPDQQAPRPPEAQAWESRRQGSGGRTWLCPPRWPTLSSPGRPAGARAAPGTSRPTSPLSPAASASTTTVTETYDSYLTGACWPGDLHRDSSMILPSRAASSLALSLGLFTDSAVAPQAARWARHAALPFPCACL